MIISWSGGGGAEAWLPCLCVTVIMHVVVINRILFSIELDSVINVLFVSVMFS